MLIVIAFVVAIIVYVLGKALFEKRVPEPYIFVASLCVFLLVLLGFIKIPL